ncbi:MAG: hypothetical protein EOP10_01590 [Proteobacteria bacterium]|nr:MAG: hypothetical protein EOP10_01590 [Pseudomonadota bacterium]
MTMVLGVYFGGRKFMLKLTLLFLVLLIESKALALGRGGRVPCGPIVPGFEEFMSYSSEHFYDSDDDGAPEWDSRVWICSGDNIGHYYTIEDTDNPSLERSYDCDPNDKRYWAWYTVYGPDADGDSFPSVVTEPMKYAQVLQSTLIEAGICEAKLLTVWSIAKIVILR